MAKRGERHPTDIAQLKGVRLAVSNEIDEGEFWALSRHADVVEGFRDHVRFSSAHGVSLDPAASGPHAHRTMSFLAMDPPEQTRLRKLVSKGFTPKRVGALEPQTRPRQPRQVDRPDRRQHEQDVQRQP